MELKSSRDSSNVSGLDLLKKLHDSSVSENVSTIKIKTVIEISSDYSSELATEDLQIINLIEENRKRKLESIEDTMELETNKKEYIYKNTNDPNNTIMTKIDNLAPPSSPAYIPKEYYQNPEIYMEDANHEIQIERYQDEEEYENIKDLNEKEFEEMFGSDVEIV